MYFGYKESLSHVGLAYMSSIVSLSLLCAVGILQCPCGLIHMTDTLIIQSTARISIISSLMSYSLAHVSHCAPSLDPLLGKAMKCTYFFSLLASVYRTNTNHELITHLRAECSDSMFSKVSLVRSSFFTVCYLPYHQKEQKSLPHHFGKIQVFAALLWSTGTFSKGDGECD